MKLQPIVAAAGAAVLLAACGGSDYDEAAVAAANNVVPASATVSVAAYTQFVGSLASTETGQPRDVTGVVPPTSETEPPQAI